MHLIKISPRTRNGRFMVECPYCHSPQSAKINPIGSYHHNCPDAGRVIFMNGYCWVGVPNYIAQEKAERTNKKS